MNCITHSYTVQFLPFLSSWRTPNYPSKTMGKNITSFYEAYPENTIWSPQEEGGCSLFSIPLASGVTLVHDIIILCLLACVLRIEVLMMGIFLFSLVSLSPMSKPMADT